MSDKMKSALVSGRLGGLVGKSDGAKQLDLERDARAPHHRSSYGSASRSRSHQDYSEDALEIPHFLDRRHKSGDHKTQARGPLNDDIGHLGHEPARSVSVRNMGGYDPHPTYSEVRVRLVRPRVIEGRRHMDMNDKLELASSLWATMLEAFSKQRIVLRPDTMRACRPDFDILVDQMLDEAMHQRVDLSNSRIVFGGEADEEEAGDDAEYKVDVYANFERGQPNGYRFEVSKDGVVLHSESDYPSASTARKAGEQALGQVKAKAEAAAEISDGAGENDGTAAKWLSAETNVYMTEGGGWCWRATHRTSGEVLYEHPEFYEDAASAMDAGSDYITARVNEMP